MNESNWLFDKYNNSYVLIDIIDKNNVLDLVYDIKKK